MAIAQTKFDLSEAKQKLAKSQRANPYCVQAEISASQEVTGLEEGLKFAEKVLTERF